MTQYEKAALRLALLAAAQRQALIAIAAMQADHPEATQLAIEGDAMLDKALNSVGKLL